jgi:hypothetical protein
VLQRVGGAPLRPEASRALGLCQYCARTAVRGGPLSNPDGPESELRELGDAFGQVGLVHDRLATVDGLGLVPRQLHRHGPRHARALEVPDGRAVGIQHVYIKVRSPRLNGKVERSHRTDAMEFYQLLSYKDDVDPGAKLAEWERFYNLVRPHGARRGKTPYEVLRERLSSESDCQAPA